VLSNSECAKTVLQPLPVDVELHNLIKEGARKAHLSQAEVMRASMRIGIPELLRRLKNGRFGFEGWSRKELAKAYQNKRVDRDYASKEFVPFFIRK